MGRLGRREVRKQVLLGIRDFWGGDAVGRKDRGIEGEGIREQTSSTEKEVVLSRRGC